ncbi:MAG: NAD(P)H-dependent oxidoreductase, partial [Alphaproteobacteria bacterium]|nr:NAD(P)H-dependent oxidoreductase [Alphaproteobacteria bacterium]
MIPKLLAFAGSTRRDSFNARLVHFAAGEARAAGAQATVLDRAAFDLPLYNGDLKADEGLPVGVARLKDLFLAHDGSLIASPEYNNSILPLLKNAIDWVSRPVAGRPPLAEYVGKVAGLMAASLGALGGLRSLAHVRQILSGVAPAQHTVPQRVQRRRSKRLARFSTPLRRRRRQRGHHPGESDL